MIPKTLLYVWPAMAGRPPTKTAPPFGKRLATLRQSKALSQETLARLLKTTRANIAYYERNATNPSLEFIQRCADVLDVPLNELISEVPASKAGKPGPKSKLERQFESISQLPRSEQQFVSKLLDQLLNQKAS